MMRTLKLSAIRAFAVSVRPKPVMCAAHIALRFRYFTFGYCHLAALSSYLGADGLFLRSSLVKPIAQSARRPY